MQAASSNHESQSFLNENRLSLIKQVFVDGIPVKGELFIKGPKLYSACYLPVFREQKVVSVIAWYQDITTKEKLGKELGTELELALEKVRELEAVFEYSHDGIWVMNGEGVTLRVNKSWEEFSGIKREEVIRKTVFALLFSRGKESDWVFTLRNPFSGSGPPNAVVYVLILKNGLDR
ncbi:MAG: PAS domain S-box protein [Bacillota bacterium]